MPRFIIGDNLGNIKAACYNDDGTFSLSNLQTGIQPEIIPIGIQRLAAAQINGSSVVAASYVDGSTSSFILEDESLTRQKTWNEPRLKSGKHTIGLSIKQSGVYTCTNNGALRLTPHNETEPSTSLLPTRLCAWRLAKGDQTFAYGGDEVDVSVWNTERAFHNQPPNAAESKKRKRNELFPAEVWRAKNVPNDGLSLRHPVRVTCLTHSAQSSSDIFAGTQLGHIRRYDTRAARKPVADWRDPLRTGKGIECVEAGSEYEIFAADAGNTLCSLDTRNGHILYRYEGISGAVQSIAPSSSTMASVSLDRYIRFHSTTPPPTNAGQNLDVRGKVLGKVYAVGQPTVIVWDQDTPEGVSAVNGQEADDDEIWGNMLSVHDDDEVSRKRKSTRTGA